MCGNPEKKTPAGHARGGLSGPQEACFAAPPPGPGAENGASSSERLGRRRNGPRDQTEKRGPRQPGTCLGKYQMTPTSQDRQSGLQTATRESGSVCLPGTVSEEEAHRTKVASRSDARPSSRESRLSHWPLGSGHAASDHQQPPGPWELRLSSHLQALKL